jgi:aryl-alcohol dehydrogenase-like predicted oxidoreductase
VHPIAALQSEWSLWSRDIEAAIIPTCRELGIALVPFSPLGRGFLTGTISSRGDIEEGDVRRNYPRFVDGAFEANNESVETVKEIAAEHDASAGQIALAWLLNQGPDVVPIPGTKRLRYLDDNLGADGITLTAADLARLDNLPVVGERAFDSSWINRSTPPLVR